MGIINVLDLQTSNLLAAGEVVERPASVVKELLENSIDAGADKITVEIRGGGTRLIRVTDNGCGMAKDDLPRCVLRHATSKIRTGEDLEAIGTLGFRGEALAATAAVSKLTIVSKRKGEPAHKMTVDCGSVEGVVECPAPDGTTVSVAELFANIPARRKFLKKDVSEAAAVASVCEKLALSSPELSLTFTSDGEKKFATPGDGSVPGAVYAVLGRQLAADLINIKASSGGITVHGVLMQPTNARANRAFELFFINGRYVRSAVISSALEAATQSFIPKEKYPAAVLYLSVHPSYVDVNVHPTKTEVRFSSDRAVFDAVFFAVKSAVTSGVTRPEYDAPTPPPSLSSSFLPITDSDAEKPVQSTAFDNDTSDPLNIQTETVRAPSPAQATAVRSAPPDATSSQPQGQYPFASTVLFPGRPVKPVTEEAARPPERAEPTPEERVPESHITGWRYLGEAFETYLFVQTSEEELLIIDKHAAHERMLFERLKNGVRSKTGYSQLICIPLDVSLSPDEEAAAVEYAEQLRETGFEFTVSEGIASLTELPSNLTEAEAADLFIGAVAELAAGQGTPELSRDIIYEKALYQSCCKAAIKGGDVNSAEELEGLIQRLLDSPEITYCPHGRPVAFRMSRAALQKRFGRD